MDQRDDLTWIAVELTRFGETKVEDGTIATLLCRDLKTDPDFPVFVPALTFSKNGKNVTLQLMEGYVFVGSGLNDIRYYRLEDLPYVAKVMSGPVSPHGMRTLSVIPNRNIEQMRKQLREMVASDIEVGDFVCVTNGPYRSLEGDVLGLDGDNAFVRIRLRSLRVIATVPRIFLDTPDAV